MEYFPICLCHLYFFYSVQFSHSVVSDSKTPWTATWQASLSISQGLLKLMSIEPVMSSNHLILCHPLLLQPSIYPSERLLLNMQRCWDSWPPEEKNSIWGQRRGLITQSFCIIKFYWSIKEIEKASDIGIRKGQKEYPLASVSIGIILSLISYYSESKECLEVVKTSLDLLP